MSVRWALCFQVSWGHSLWQPLLFRACCPPSSQESTRGNPCQETLGPTRLTSSGPSVETVGNQRLHGLKDKKKKTCFLACGPVWCRCGKGHQPCLGEGHRRHSREKGPTVMLCLLRKPLVPSSFMSLVSVRHRKVLFCEEWLPSLSSWDRDRHGSTHHESCSRCRAHDLRPGLCQGHRFLGPWAWPRAPASDMGLKTAGHAGPRDCSGRASSPPDIVTAPATLLCPPSVQVRDTFCPVYRRRAGEDGGSEPLHPAFPPHLWPQPTLLPARAPHRLAVPLPAPR